MAHRFVNGGFAVRCLFVLLMLSPCATFESYSVQKDSGTRRESIDCLEKGGPAARNVNGVQYTLVREQSQWAQMLYLDRNYDTVTKGIRELLAQNTESSSFALYKRYAVLATIPDTRHVGLMKDVLNEWCRRDPDSHIPWLVRGTFYSDLAWIIRGGGYASTVSEDSWEGFYKNLEWARKDLERSYKLNPKDPNAACHLMRVALGSGGDPRETERHFRNATSADPGHYGAHRQMYVFLLPQWGGSVEAMNAFADHCLALSQKFPYLGLIKTAAYDDMIKRRNVAGYAGEVDRYIKGNDVWSVMDGIYRRILDRYPDDLVTRLNYARSAVLYDQGAVASGQFEIIGDLWVMTSLWGSLEEYHQARSSVSRAAAAGGRSNSTLAGPDAGNPAPGDAVKDPVPPAGPISYPNPRDRQRHADQLARQGEDAEALAEYLWCFDEGMRKAPEYAGVRLSFLLSSIARLGLRYPPALQQLRNRRDAAKASLDGDPGNHSAQADFAAINRELGEKTANLAFFDQLPLKGAARASFGRIIFDQLVEAKRYRDAVEAKPYHAFMRELSQLLSMMNQSTSLATTRYIMTSGGKELQVLAGAGNFDEAREILGILRKLDASEENLGRLRLHLERAGHADLLDETLQQEPSANGADVT